jgi:8-amino-7-oxononanoate synthase
MFEKELTTLREQDQYRILKTISQNNGREINFGQKTYLNFSSNDYLGLAQPIQTISAQSGAGAAALVSGNQSIHDELSKIISDWKQKERTLLFPSGFQANVAAVTGLADKETLILYDKLSHASLIDGILLSGAKAFSYLHLNYQNLETKLEKFKDYPKKIIVTDSIFSMDGDAADLKKLVQLKKKYNALLIVDEAHGVGAYGATGAGLCEEQNVSQDVDVIVTTFSKAVGAQGGSISASHEIIDYLINFSRPYIFSTTLSPLLVLAVKNNIEIIRSDRGLKLKNKLKSNINYFCQKAEEIGLKLISQSAIQPLVIGSATEAKKAYEILLNKGIFIPLIRYPAVPKDSARLRLSLTAQHTEEDILKLVAALKPMGDIFKTND